MKQLRPEQEQKLNGVLAMMAQPQQEQGGGPQPTPTAGTTVDTAALLAEIARLKAENEALAKGVARTISFKVSEKGGVSVYGLGRFPITLYREQWEGLLAKEGELRAFIEAAHKAGKLATDEDKARRKAERAAAEAQQSQEQAKK